MGRHGCSLLYTCTPQLSPGESGFLVSPDWQTWPLCSLLSPIASLDPFFFLTHPETNSDFDYILEPEGWEGYLQTWSQLFVVPLSSNSNKHNPSPCLIQERTSFVGSLQLMNGLYSKICLWLVVRAAKADPRINEFTGESGGYDSPTDWLLLSFPGPSLCAGV